MSRTASKKSAKPRKKQPPRAKSKAVIKSTAKTASPPKLARYPRLLTTRYLSYSFAFGALLVLLLTTVFWSLLAARLQAGNADQLVNSYLFNNAKTFQAAQLPIAHSFLLKWPVFFVIHLFGTSLHALKDSTIVLSLLTVGLLALVIQRIERRPLVWGTILLMLASVLLMIPAQPYPGALLPLNMAMVATRNIEYILLLAGTYCLISRPKIKSHRFWLGVGLLGILFASDKLFLTLGVGGAALAAVCYLVVRHRLLTRTSSWWLAGSLIAAGLSVVLLKLISALHITHIVGAAAGPYGLTTSPKLLAQGVFYTLTGLLTNLGANPAANITLIRQMPLAARQNLEGLALIPILSNLLIFLTGLGLVVQTWYRSLFTKHFARHINRAEGLSVALVWMTIIAVGAFVVTHHYYAVDARYLGLALFTWFIVLAAASRRRVFRRRTLLLVATGFLLSIGCGVVLTYRSYQHGRDALLTLNQRNASVAAALEQHPVQVLMGDYWRVLPVKLASNNHLNVAPLENCTVDRQILSSTVWQPDLRHQSFAYLLSFDQKPTDFPTCSLEQVTAAYGHPNSSLVVAGSIVKPEELLLFYDHGSQASAPHINPNRATVGPISLQSVGRVTCNAQPTVMNIVAHQDDDLLFMNPDIIHDIQAGDCIRTVYVTAGDAGSGQFFWLSRQQGSEAAYSQMLGFHDIWIERTISVGQGEYITVANPRGDPKVSLIFMHLPDGNPDGRGFPSSHFESLAKLSHGTISTVQTVDGQSSYSADQLVSALNALMRVYQPLVVNTQANFVSHVFPDHSDHIAVGYFVKQAYAPYEVAQLANQLPISIAYYVGYPIHNFAPNVDGADLTAKEAAFFEYARFDGGVCRSVSQCNYTPTYNAYLHREYTNPD